MEKINPEITQKFVESSKKNAEKGTYRVEVKIGDKIVPIDVYPEVFPPKSDYSVSSKSVFEAFGDLAGQEVADVGSGSGIESIVAAMAGANHVDATDIEDVAVKCTKHNVELNDLSGKISVFKGDLFESLPNKKYDLIIINLPIVDYKPEEDSAITNALYDPEFSLHKRTFVEAKKFLKENGVLVFTHANLQSVESDNSDRDFQDLEKIISEYGYDIVEKRETVDLGYKWINYKISLRKN